MQISTSIDIWPYYPMRARPSRVPGRAVAEGEGPEGRESQPQGLGREVHLIHSCWEGLYVYEALYRYIYIYYIYMYTWCSAV